MAAVNILAVRINNNPAKFQDPFSFEIEYEALANLQDDLEWKLIYVGSADNDVHDQTLESILVGPVIPGNFRFVLEANPPDAAMIPADDVLGVTVILLTCSYRGNEFVRVGYYVNNEYLEEELRENPPEQPLYDRVHRSILADHPRVTRFAVAFDEPAPAEGAADDAAMDATIPEQPAASDWAAAQASAQPGSAPAPAFHDQQPSAHLCEQHHGGFTSMDSISMVC